MIIEKSGVSKGLQYVVAIKETLGFRMGYVAVPVNLAISLQENDLDCHGGLTYMGENNGYPVSTSDDIKWIGFDCGHCGDAPDIDFTRKLLKDENLGESVRQTLELQIQMWSGFADANDTVKDVEYVENECKSLIKQVNKLTKKYI
jgi:hypothetical protein